MPVKTFARPEKTRVLPRLMDPFRVIAIIKGSSVPRSPNDPESSASGALRSVFRLCSLMALRFARQEAMVEDCSIVSV